MLDLKKAFDTVHNETLIDKLKLYDLDDKCIAWFKDYISNRSQNVSVNGISSKQADSVCGIPQGSILLDHYCSLYTSMISRILFLVKLKLVCMQMILPYTLSVKM